VQFQVPMTVSTGVQPIGVSYSHWRDPNFQRINS
jgi:hypothetical protein